MSDNWNDRATRTYTPPVREEPDRGPGSVDFMTDQEWFEQYRDMDRDQLEKMVRLRDIELHQERDTSGFLRSELRALEKIVAETDLASAFMRAEQRVQQVEAENRALRTALNEVRSIIRGRLNVAVSSQDFSGAQAIREIERRIEDRSADAGFGTEWGTEGDR